MHESKSGVGSETKSAPRGLMPRMIARRSSPQSMVSAMTLRSYLKYKAWGKGVVLGPRLRRPPSVQEIDARKEERERLKAKAEVKRALERTANLRQAVARIAEHYRDLPEKKQ